MGTNSIRASPPGLSAPQLYHHDTLGPDAEATNAAEGPAFWATPRLQAPRPPSAGAASETPPSRGSAARLTPASMPGGSRIGCNSLEPQAPHARSAAAPTPWITAKPMGRSMTGGHDSAPRRFTFLANARRRLT